MQWKKTLASKLQINTCILFRSPAMVNCEIIAILALSCLCVNSHHHLLEETSALFLCNSKFVLDNFYSPDIAGA